MGGGEHQSSPRVLETHSHHASHALLPTGISPLLSPSLEGAAHFLYLKSRSDKASASRWHRGAVCQRVPSSPPQAPRTRLPGSCPHPPGPLSAPTESALPGQVRCPDYWVCCCCSLNGEIGERTRKVRRHHRGAYSQSERQQCPSQRALGAREKAGVPVPANPGSKPFSFPAAHWAPGSQQESQEHRLWNLKDVSLNQAQSLYTE